MLYIALLLLCVRGAYGFIPVLGVIPQDELSGVYQDNNYIAKKSFTSALGKDEVMARCYMAAEMAGWAVTKTKEICIPSSKKAADGVTARSGNMTWHATVKTELKNGGCKGCFIFSFPKKEKAVLPEVGLVYPSGTVVLRTLNQQGGEERVLLTLECHDSPAIVLPYVKKRFLGNGWREQQDLYMITSQFGDEKNPGKLFQKPGASVFIISIKNTPTDWWYIFSVKRILNKER